MPIIAQLAPDSVEQTLVSNNVSTTEEKRANVGERLIKPPIKKGSALQTLLSRDSFVALRANIVNQFQPEISE